MKFRYSVLLILALSMGVVQAQVGVGTTTPKGALDINSANSGMLVPRVQLTSLTVAAPVTNPQTGALENGTLVYNLGPVAPGNLAAGFYYWNTTTWVSLAGGGAATPTDAWLTTGNAGTTASNYLGTTDDKDLYFKTNGVNRLRITSDTSFGQLLAYDTSPAFPTYSFDKSPFAGMNLISQGSSRKIVFQTDQKVVSGAQPATSRFEIPSQTFQVHAMDRGTALLPFYSWSVDQNTGFFSPAADQLGFSTNGVERVRIGDKGQVGIGTGTPNGALDVSSTNSGFIAPRLALTSAIVAAPVTNPVSVGALLVAGTIVYNTATAGTAPDNVTPGYYYWNGAKWVRMEGGGATPPATSHNTLNMAYNEGGAGLGRKITASSGAVEIAGNTTDYNLYVKNNSSTSGVSGIYSSVVNNNTIGYGATVSSIGVGLLIDHTNASTNFSGLQVATSSNGTSAGIFSKSNGTTPALALEGGQVGATIDVMRVTNVRTDGGSGIDVKAAVGVRSLSQTNLGSAFSGYLNANKGVAGQFNGADIDPVPIITYTAITGPAASLRIGTATKGNRLGMFSSFSNVEGAAFEGYVEAYDLDIYYGAVIGLNFYDVYRMTQPTAPQNSKKVFANVIGSGINATTLTKENKTIVMPAVSAPESLFQDYGTGTLVNGRASISIHPLLTENILVDATHPLKVFVQLEGECNGVFVTNKTATGFDVVELGNGASNVGFSYSLVATRASKEVTTKNGTTETINYSGRFMSFDNAKQEMKLLDDRPVIYPPMDVLKSVEDSKTQETK